MSQINQNLVSVVIPTYNRSALLKQAIKSVLNQNYKNLEIIVVDDNSSDDTKTVVEDLQCDLVKYIKLDKNLGGAATRNVGINIASGEFITFLDDDDEYLENKIVDQIEKLFEYQIVLCGTKAKSSGKLNTYGKNELEKQDIVRGKTLEGGTSTIMARANFMRGYLFDENLRRWQDWDLLIRIAKEHPIGTINKPLVLYNDGTHNRITNQLKSMSVNQALNRAQMLEKHKDFFGDYWYRYHIARGLLSYLRNKVNKVEFIKEAIARSGYLAVAAYFFNRARIKVTRKA